MWEVWEVGSRSLNGTTVYDVKSLFSWAECDSIGHHQARFYNCQLLIIGVKAIDVVGKFCWLGWELQGAIAGIGEPNRSVTFDDKIVG